MLSSIFNRVLTTVRPMQNYQPYFFVRLLSTTQTNPTENISNNRETGIVKRFSKEKGYGFISKNSDGTDCFVHFKNINATGFKALEQGQEVEFTVAQGEKGIEAKDVNVIGAGTSRSFFRGLPNNRFASSRFGSDGLSKNQSLSKFDYDGDNDNASSTFNSINQDSTLTDKLSDSNDNLTREKLFSSRGFGSTNEQKRQLGSVKRWSTERGFGFIRRNNGGPDLFCHVRSLRNGLQELAEGQTVEYRIRKTEKGDEARDVTIFDADAQQNEASSNIDPTERQTGTVRRWLPEKRYGFIRLNTDGSDVFVHLQDITDGNTSLKEGQTVEFNIKNSEKGPAAQDVIVRNEN